MGAHWESSRRDLIASRDLTTIPLNVTDDTNVQTPSDLNESPIVDSVLPSGSKSNPYTNGANFIDMPSGGSSSNAMPGCNSSVLSVGSGTGSSSLSNMMTLFSSLLGSNTTTPVTNPSPLGNIMTLFSSLLGSSTTTSGTNSSSLSDMTSLSSSFIGSNSPTTGKNLSSPGDMTTTDSSLLGSNFQTTGTNPSSPSDMTTTYSSLLNSNTTGTPDPSSPGSTLPRAVTPNANDAKPKPVKPESEHAGVKSGNAKAKSGRAKVMPRRAKAKLADTRLKSKP